MSASVGRRMSASGRDCKLERSRIGRWRDTDVFAGILWPLCLTQRPFKQGPVAGATVCMVSGSVNTPTTGHRQQLCCIPAVRSSM